MAAKNVKVVKVGCRCERCGHEWVPMDTEVDEEGREEPWEPGMCPKCKSKLWDVAK